MKLLETLETVAWGMRHFGSIMTGGKLKMSDIRRAINKRLVKSIGVGMQCDADGFALERRREREGFELTEEGKDFLKKEYPDAEQLYSKTY